MAAPIGPGDWVEVIRASGRYGFRPGQLYLCTSVPERELPCDVCGKCHRGISVKNAPAARPADWLWPVCCFKPIYRPKADFIESLKAPPKAAPVKAPEHVGSLHSHCAAFSF